MALYKLKPTYNPRPCTNHHVFVRYTGRNWRRIGVKQPLPNDICRNCGRTRKEVFGNAVNECALTHY